MFLGSTSNNSERLVFRKNIQNEYITKTLSQEIRVEKKDITETQQFKSLFEKYTRNLKENALAPYTDNDNFRSAIKDFGTPLFQKYDNRLKQDVTQMIGNLKKKFSYTPEGAKQVSLYVLDKKLASKY